MYAPAPEEDYQEDHFRPHCPEQDAGSEANKTQSQDDGPDGLLMGIPVLLFNGSVASPAVRS
jgi:hypothetical protein